MNKCSGQLSQDLCALLQYHEKLWWEFVYFAWKRDTFQSFDEHDYKSLLAHTQYEVDYNWVLSVYVVG